MILNHRFGRAFLCSILSVLILSGCQAPSVKQSSPSAVDQAETLRVGVSTNAPPLIYRKNDRVTGLEASLAGKLGAYLNRKVVFIEVPWEKQIQYLMQGKTDIIMSGMTITQERAYLVNFTTPYMQSGQIMLVRLEDNRLFNTGIGSLLNTNYRIGTVSGTVSDLFITSTIVGANEVSFDTSQEAVDALIKKKIDVFVYDAPIICYYAAMHQADKLIPVLSLGTEEYLGWAVRKEDSELLAGANRFIESLQQQKQLTAEIKHWIPYLYR